MVVSNWSGERWTAFDLDVLDERGEALRRPAVDVSLIHPSKAFLRRSKGDLIPFRVEGTMGDAVRARQPGIDLLDCGGRAPSADGDRGALLTSDRPDLIAMRYPDAWEVTAGAERTPAWRVELRPMSQTVVGLKVAVPHRAKPGRSIKLHFVQRRSGTATIVGGIAVQVNVRDPRDRPDHPSLQTPDG